MSEQEQKGRALAANESRTVAVRPSGNPLVARGLADLSNRAEVPEVHAETASELRGIQMALVHNAAKRLLVKHGHAPILEEIAAECGLAAEDILGIQRSFFADPLYSGCRLALGAALRTCSYREREAMKLLYGLGDGYIYTYEEVGHIFKVSEEFLRGVERDALATILAYFDDKDWNQHAQASAVVPPSA